MSIIHENSHQSSFVDGLSSKTLQCTMPHHREWVEGSGVDSSIAVRAFVSLSDRKEIASSLGWQKYSNDYPLGWVARGLDLATMKLQEFCQFKPDEEILLPGKEKKTKYLSDKGHPYDAIALPHRDGVAYWQKVLDDPLIPTASTEGTKKSGALMTCGFPALAVCGVAMWQKKGLKL